MDLKKACRILISGIFLSGIGSLILHGQPERKYIRQGNGDYRDNKFAEAELNYRKALDKNRISHDARFNLGNALYRQEKMDEAGKLFTETATNSPDEAKKADAFYNYGNTLLKSEKFQEAIGAYKNSLKLNPGSMEAKYNLAYAQDMLRQQEEEKNKENQKNQEQEDKQQQNQNQDKNQEQDNNKDKNQQQNQQQQQQQGISKEDANRLLEALANDEKKVQEKVREAKAANARVRTRINW